MTNVRAMALTFRDAENLKQGARRTYAAARETMVRQGSVDYDQRAIRLELAWEMRRLAHAEISECLGLDPEAEVVDDFEGMARGTPVVDAYRACARCAALLAPADPVIVELGVGEVCQACNDRFMPEVG